MGFFDNIKKKVKKPEEIISNIGESEPVCPYCSVSLDKMPKRKQKCPSCKNDIYVRTRPSDEMKILIRDEQIEELEKQWAIKNGTLEQYNIGLEMREKEKLRFENEKIKIKDKLGYEPRDNDVQWALFNEDRILSAGGGRFWEYSSITQSMGNQLKKEKKLLSALNFYLEVCYLEINEATNEGYYNTDPKIIEKHRITFGYDLEPMTPKVPPALYDYIIKIQKEEKLTIDDIKDTFISYNTRMYSHSKMRPPLSPEDAWNHFIDEYNRFLKR